MNRVEFDIAIVGSGVVGLACAEALSKKHPDKSIVVLERHSKFGQEASSHNSEVIHAGIYYQPGSYKALSCLRGKDLLYEFCQSYDVPFRKCGKYIVASDASQIKKLEQIAANSLKNGVELEILEKKDLGDELPAVPVEMALKSSSTGIVDSHSLMDRLLSMSQERGVLVMFNHTVKEVVSSTADEVCVRVAAPDGDFELTARFFVNAAGLGAARIANHFRPNDKIEIRPCRGRYFDLSDKWTNRFSSLIYPVPDPAGGLGVHLTMDLLGHGRLGPDVDWSKKDLIPDEYSLYGFDESDRDQQKNFFEAGSKFLPGLKLEDLSPGYIGVRSKLFWNGEAKIEFVVSQLDLRVPSLHLLGIESPGVTSALAIAADVAETSEAFLSKRVGLNSCFH